MKFPIPTASRRGKDCINADRSSIDALCAVFTALHLLYRALGLDFKYFVCKTHLDNMDGAPREGKLT